MNSSRSTVLAQAHTKQADGSIHLGLGFCQETVGNNKESRDFGKRDGLDGPWKLSRIRKKQRQEGGCQSTGRMRTVVSCRRVVVQSGVLGQGRAIWHVDIRSTALGSQGKGVETRRVPRTLLMLAS